ncbi:MAG: hypothetical protein CFE44_17055 [Burkholderiales bacterium PBB4]|nr:MAG: hypothetical protein CFE44_17055 [Burkholderiales bacterium PBB4]
MKAEEMNAIQFRPAVPPWFWLVAGLGLAWNVFGIFQFLPTVQATLGSLMANGLTQAQAELYLALPVWMTIAFAVGVFGGTLGCVLMLWRMSLATTVFGTSLVAYGVLYMGDITQGVFAAFGLVQVAILTTVVGIAAGLLWTSLRYLSSAPRGSKFVPTV